MATHDYVIDNASGSAVRGDINQVLEAIVTNNSNGSTPGTTFAYMWWADTGDVDTLKIREGGTTNFIKLFDISGSGQTYLGDGTLAKPGLCFRDDTDTGLRRPSSGDNAGDLHIVQDGSRVMTIATNGDVAIGDVNTPQADLHIERAADCVLQLTAGGSNNARIQFGDTGDPNEGKIEYDCANQALKFTVATNIVAKFDDSGNFGINLGNPVEKLHVDGNIKTTGNLVTSGDLDIQSGKIFSKTTSFPTGTVSGGNYTGVDADGFELQNAGVHSLGRNTAAANNVLKVYGGAGQCRVKGDGDLENTNNRYDGLSDSRLKENIVDASSQWEDIKGVRVRNYNFKESTGFSTDRQLGVIAQELETVSPGLVTESNEEDNEGNVIGSTKTVSYSILYMKAVKALQEAMERIETLEAKVASLETGSY